MSTVLDLVIPKASQYGTYERYRKRVLERLFWLFGEEVLNDVAAVVEKAISETVPRVMISKHEELSEVFNNSMQLFSNYMLPALIKLNAPILSAKEEELRDVTEALKNAEREFYKELSTELKDKGEKVAGLDVDKLLYGLSVLFDYDIWLLEKLAKYGFKLTPAPLLKGRRDRAL